MYVIGVYCVVACSGLRLHTAATVNKEAHVRVRIFNSNGKPIPCISLTAELLPFSKEPHMKFRSKKMLTCIQMAHFPAHNGQCRTQQLASHGLYHLHIDASSKPIEGSPFAIIVYPDPTQMGLPVSTLPDLSRPYSVAINSCDEIVVTECRSHQVSVLDPRGKKL